MTGRIVRFPLEKGFLWFGNSLGKFKDYSNSRKKLKHETSFMIEKIFIFNKVSEKFLQNSTNRQSSKSLKASSEKDICKFY